jgi:endo-1,4-beta-D-glucanase Y
MSTRSQFSGVALACLALCACTGQTAGGGDDDPTPGRPDARRDIDARGPEPDEPDARRADARVPDARPPGPGEPDAAPTPDARESSGCQRSGDATQPFGNHALAYADGTAYPHGDPAAKDAAVTRFYEIWKSRHLRQACGSGQYYVAYTGGNETVSEAHGYGMLIAVLMAGYDDEARTIFDGMVRYYQGHRSGIQDELMSWKQSSCRNVDGNNSATDGDLDIAYALLLADKQWGSGGALNYRELAEILLRGILAGEVDSTRGYLFLGDWARDSNSELRNATRPSDFMPGHLASFARVAGGDFTRLLDREYQTMATAQSRLAPTTGLFPDFLLDPLGTPRAPSGRLLEDEGDDDYEYNACRVPWRMGSHFVISGDSRAKAIANKMTSWIKAQTGGNPREIKAGYRLNGQSIGNDYVDMAFVAPFGVAAMVDRAHQAWLNTLWDVIVADQGGGYYGDTIKVLSMIVMSGNWWAPEAAPCD